MPYKLYGRESSFIHSFHYHKRLSESAALYLTHTLRSFSLSLIGIFLPIYFYKISQDVLLFSDNVVKNSLVWVLSYYFIASLSSLIVMVVFTNFIFTKLTFRRSIMLSLLLTIIQVWFWLLAETNIYYIWFSGILEGAIVILYWIPYHISFVRKVSEKDQSYGKSLGIRLLLIRVFSGIAPLIGGVILSSLGFTALFVVSMVTLLTSGLPIFITVSENKHSRHDVRHVMSNYVLNKKYLNTTLTFIGVCIEEHVFSVFWSVLLFLSLQNFTSIGTLNSISLVLSSLLVLYIGGKIDKKGSKKIHLVGVIINSLLYIPRVFINLPPVLYFLELADKLNGTLYVLPRLSLVYKNGEKANLSDYIIYRELVLKIVGPFVVLGLALFVLLFNWRYIFFVGLVGSILSFFIQFDSKD